MKFFVSAGHPMYKGAAGILDETVVDRAVVKELDLVLREMGHIVNVLNSESVKDYVEEVQVANSSSYDWYVDIHANCYHKEAANGVETLVYADNKPQAHAISKNISDLGFYNRGVKTRTDLYILKNTKAKALLVECFFISNQNDCNLYNKIGPKKIAIAIAEGLTGQTYKSNVSSVESQVSNNTVGEKPTSTGDDWVRRLQQECNKQGFSNQKVDGIAGPVTLAGCPVLKKGAQGNITKLLQERLVKLGYSTNGVDGIFGSGTYSAVREFQKTRGLSADGIVGQNTWRKLLNL